ncbi:MAG: hypothetical protein Q9226_008263, partial [Calogaya cf. arnoldii]
PQAKGDHSENRRRKTLGTAEDPSEDRRATLGNAEVAWLIEQPQRARITLDTERRSLENEIQYLKFKRQQVRVAKDQVEVDSRYFLSQLEAKKARLREVNVMKTFYCDHRPENWGILKQEAARLQHKMAGLVMQAMPSKEAQEAMVNPSAAKADADETDAEAGTDGTDAEAETQEMDTEGMDSLSVLDGPILGNHGARYEGDIFSVAKSSPFTIQAHEFAEADGAIDAATFPGYDKTTGYIERFWDTDRRADQPSLELRPCLVFFDCKSAVGRAAEEQMYLTRVRQRCTVAFYLAICAVDPSFVELIPNFCQALDESESRSTAEQVRYVAANSSRASKLDPKSYRLSPCNAPYRMPLALLPQALARTGEPYINPHTRVCFESWKPQTSTSSAYLKPTEDSGQYSAYMATMHIYRTVKSRSDLPMSMDFLGLQPRLADFKFKIGRRRTRQVLIQHKLDSKGRALEAPLHKVGIARGDAGNRRWYFTPFERFDFLFYQFEFSQGTCRSPRKEFFFLPERELPSSFYTTTEIETTFELQNFRRYRFFMDDGGKWLDQVYAIIESNPQPRHASPRPTRPITLVEKEIPKPIDAAFLARQGYTEVLHQRHRYFFDRIMRQCAARSSGLITCFSAEHPLGDFGFCQYTWTSKDQQRYRVRGLPPRTNTDLPAETHLVPIYCFARDLECQFTGPAVTPAQFRRLNSQSVARLIIWDLGGRDTIGTSTPLAIVPSEDCAPSDTQRKLYADSLKVTHGNRFTARMPLVTDLLNSGLYASEYIVGAGPEYEENNLSDVWKLLNSFACRRSVEHPEGIHRDAALYRHPLRLFHQVLATEHEMAAKAGMTIS